MLYSANVSWTALTRSRRYSLAAGLALGLVTLGRGSNAVGLSDLQIENRLHRFMVGGKSMEEPWVSKRHAAQESTSRIKEGTRVNIDVTAPGLLVVTCMLGAQQCTQAQHSPLG